MAGRGRIENIQATMFKPGQSGNPAGRPKGSWRRDEVEALLGRLMRMTKKELLAVTKSRKANMLEIMVASVMIKAEKFGDYSRLQFVLDRIVGKVRDNVHVESSGSATVTVTLPSNGREARK